MLDLLQIISILLVAIAMAPALAHACEYPGKKRLERETYQEIQAIYYPGFTVLGIFEPASILAVCALVLLTGPAASEFWLMVFALLGLIGMQLVYWTLTHPANKVWTENERKSMGSLGRNFFESDPAQRAGSKPSGMATDWRSLRDRWEYSHIFRAVLALLSFLALVVAIVL